MHNHHHSINLGTAWEPPTPVQATGCMLWTRRFGRPAGLGPGDRVLLVVSRPTVAAEMVVNAVRLPPLSAGAARWGQDITPLLRDRNELLVTMAATAVGSSAEELTGRVSLPSAVGTIALEIGPADGVADRVGDA